MRVNVYTYIYNDGCGVTLSQDSIIMPNVKSATGTAYASYTHHPNKCLTLPLGTHHPSRTHIQFPSFCSITSSSPSGLSLPPFFSSLVNHTRMSPNFDCPAHNMKATVSPVVLPLSFSFSSSFSTPILYFIVYNITHTYLYSIKTHSFFYLVCVFLVALYNNNIYS